MIVLSMTLNCSDLGMSLKATWTCWVPEDVDKSSYYGLLEPRRAFRCFWSKNIRINTFDIFKVLGIKKPKGIS